MVGGAVSKYVILTVASAITLLPLVVLVITAFKTKREFATTGPLQLPKDWFNFSNFVTAFTDGNMAVGFRNTTFVLIVSLFGTIVIGSMTAYAVDRFEFRFKKVVIGLFLVATLVPSVTTQVATFQIVNGLGLYDSLWSLIALNLGTDIISIYIFVQFMQSIPKDVDEAAMLDGANKFTIYWRVILPLLKPAIATVVIIKGIAIYNEFYQAFLYAPSQENAMISTALFAFKGPYGSQWQIISAGALLVIIPTLVIFLVLQRFIYNGFTQGATK
ncbi:carbohydrate ABC transporter permease [Frigoribacterium sp. UYMn621]|uniref:carbohydrate ABC transporter permease n=1 Tax=Frigoribacterium sp. UYMn621 TaxID=3156343 RepID=UPI00339B4EDF